MKNVLVSEKKLNELLEIKQQYEVLNRPEFEAEIMPVPDQDESLELEIARLNLKNAELEKTIEQLRQQMEWMLQKDRLSNQKRYGSSSEKISHLQQSFFNDMEVYQDESVQDPTVDELDKSYKRKPRKKSGRNKKQRIPDTLPRETRSYPLNEDQLECPPCHQQYEQIGKAQKRERLKVLPARFVIYEESSCSYVCPFCKEHEDKVEIVKSELPPAFLPQSVASEETVAHIAVQKFVAGTPLYRQEQSWQNEGVEISRQSMSNWLIAADKRYLQAVVAAMHQALLQERILHADETPVQVLHEEGRRAEQKSYMWIYRTGIHSSQQLVLFNYEQDRKQIRPQTYLESFSGYLHTDGYTSYRNLPDVRVVGCMAHARRKFSDAVKATSVKDKEKTDAYQAIRYIDELFGMEGDWKGLDRASRYRKRQDEALPKVNTFYEWLRKLPETGKTKFGEAIGYALNQETYLRRYLEDGNLEISNNLAERTAKAFVIGRKVWLFANTPAGAQSSADYYSIIETAKANNLNPYDYLVWILQQGADLDLTKHPELAKQLLPDKYRETLS